MFQAISVWNKWSVRYHALERKHQAKRGVQRIGIHNLKCNIHSYGLKKDSPHKQLLQYSLSLKLEFGKVSVRWTLKRKDTSACAVGQRLRLSVFWPSKKCSMLHFLSQKFHEILLRTTSESKEFNLGFNVKTLNDELPKIPLLNIYGYNLNVQVPCKVSYRQMIEET